MATSVDEIYREALTLPPNLRATLTERLVASLAQDVPEEICRAQLEIIERRIAEVESGKVKLIPGDEALARARRVLSEAKE